MGMFSTSAREQYLPNTELFPGINDTVMQLTAKFFRGDQIQNQPITLIKFWWIG